VHARCFTPDAETALRQNYQHVSVVGIIGNAGQAIMQQPKQALSDLLNNRKEVASRGITVNAVAPGFIDTPMTQVLTPERKQALLANIPLGSLGTTAGHCGNSCFSCLG